MTGYSQPVDSDLWTAWRDDVFGDPYLVWHDGPDFRRLRKLAKAAPADVARMLAAGVAESDPVAAVAIAVLAEKGMTPEGAEALLRDAAPAATGIFLVRLAQAMFVLTGEQSWAEPIAAVLTSDAFWGVRIDAAMALADFVPAPKLVEALNEAVRDPEYLVQYHAENTLRTYTTRR
jgi:HEAT repeat protein